MFVLICVILASIYVLLGKKEKTYILSPMPEIDSIARISIQQTEHLLIFIKQQQQWLLYIDNQQTPAERVAPKKIERLLNLVRLESELAFEAQNEQLTLQQYELFPPRLVIRFDQQQLNIGGLHPLKKLRYFMINNTIHLAHFPAFDLLVQAPEFFLQP
ncbi:MAG: hypothetical protein OEZ58_14700 [Gammaproteobacteria bacterium]|nr:hypothetical protein [Gammaproteobacteria bacterium]